MGDIGSRLFYNLNTVQQGDAELDDYFQSINKPIPLTKGVCHLTSIVVADAVN